MARNGCHQHTEETQFSFHRVRSCKMWASELAFYLHLSLVFFTYNDINYLMG